MHAWVQFTYLSFLSLFLKVVIFSRLPLGISVDKIDDEFEIEEELETSYKSPDDMGTAEVDDELETSYKSPVGMEFVEDRTFIGSSVGVDNDMAET
eukprot:CAMPEP_0172423120 /NCGR_PEP_ID=MMETSP1064-20121228/12894_1 /TAXON_ID=202472 /ORGANISM="Aulacoseira subarctica , Strain CCAP 1002/5" /LENGTH=95 /DNA_ID=CAMNT_0013164295 /DNA_START=57 /DNA_END=344 /DNA_ORIENTATION=-